MAVMSGSHAIRKETIISNFLKSETSTKIMVWLKNLDTLKQSPSVQSKFDQRPVIVCSVLLREQVAFEFNFSGLVF